jgi:iron(III) transport system permease protein
MSLMSRDGRLAAGAAVAAPAATARAWQQTSRGVGIDPVEKLVLFAGAILALYLMAAPLGMLLFSAFRGPADFLPFEPGAQWTIENFRAMYRDPVLYQRVLPDTLIFAVGSVFLTSMIAFTLAWLVERTDLPGRNIWYSLILFPFLVPNPVLAIAWIFLLGPQAGWLNVWLRGIFGLGGQGPINLFSMPGLIVCQALASTPFVFVLLTAALRSMNPSFEEASGASGASPWETFRRVTLPVLLPGILAPVILVLLITLEQFEIPLIIGLPARINVFSYRIWYELNPSSGLPNYGGAAAVATPFPMIAMLLLVAYNRLTRRAESYVTVTGKAYRQRRLSLGPWRAPDFCFAVSMLRSPRFYRRSSCCGLRSSDLPRWYQVRLSDFPPLPRRRCFPAQPFGWRFATRRSWRQVQRS